MNAFQARSSLELAQLKEKASDQSLGAVLDLLLEFAFIAPTTTAGMCIEVVSAVNEFLGSRGVSVKRLEGWLEIGPHSWLEHNVSVLQLKENWVTVDFTINQIAGHEGIPFLVIVCRPSWQDVAAALKQEYRWWTPD